MKSPDQSASKSLSIKYTQQKKLLDGFLFASISANLLTIIKKLFEDAVKWGEEISLGKPTAKQKEYLKNIATLGKDLPQAKQLKYWQLLQILLRFPGKFQMGLNEDLLQMMEQDVTPMKEVMDANDYLEKSLRFFLTDCIALSRLREEQIHVLDQGERKKATQIERDFAIIPNHFLLLERLGGKGNVSVFRGVNLETNQTVVIKYLPKMEPEQLIDEELLACERFAREARAFERLQKYRKQKIDIGERVIDNYFVKAYRLARGNINHFRISKGKLLREREEEVEFMVMKHLDGVALNDFLAEYGQGTTISLKVITYILDGLFQALEFCRGENIVHRDVCPGNILITKKFQMRLTNLGWSELKDMGHLISEAAFVGTPGYTSPEGILLGKNKNIEKLESTTDHRSDLYSVGCILYELLTKRAPFSSDKSGEEGDFDLLRKHIKESPIPPKKLRPEISDRLNDFVLRLLSKKPEDRFATAKEALQEFRKSISIKQVADVLAHQVMTAGPEATQEFRLANLPKKKQSKKKYLLVALLLILGGVGYYFHTPIWQFIQDQFREKPLTPQELLVKDLQEHYQSLQKEWRECSLLVQKLKKFSREEGFPQPTSRLLSTLEHLQQQITKMNGLIAEAETQWQKDKLKEYRDFIEEDQKTIHLLKRLYKKLNNTYHTAASLRKARREEKSMRKTYRALKGYILKLDENIALVEEKIAILNERFPKRKGYLKINPDTAKEIIGSQKRLKSFEGIVKKINLALEQDHMNDAIKLTRSYTNLQFLELDKLADIDEHVEEILSVNENMQRDRLLRRIQDKTLVALEDRSRQLQNYLQKADQKWKQFKQLAPKTNLSPEGLFSHVKEEVKALKKVVKQVNVHLDQLEDKKVLALLKPYMDNEQKTLLDDIKALDEQLADSIRIEQAPKAPKVDKKIIVELLAAAKKNIAGITEGRKALEGKIKVLREEFPRVTFDRKTYQKMQRKTDLFYKQLQQVVKKVEENLTEQNLLGSLKILEANKKNIHRGKSIVAALDKSYTQINKLLIRKRKQRKTNRQLAQANRILQKLSTSVGRFDRRIIPVKRQLIQLARKYPAKDGYTQVGKKWYKVITRGQKLANNYKVKVRKAQKAVDKKKLESALKILSPFERKKLEPADWVDDMKNLEGRIADVVQIVRVEQVHIKKLKEVQKLIDQLQDRQKQLRVAIPKLRSKVNKLREYPKDQGYVHVDPQVHVYIKEARDESDELSEIIKEAAQLANKKQYEDFRSLVLPFVKEANFSRVPLLNTYLKNINKALARNKELRRNPTLRAKQKKRQNQQKQNQSQRKSPGSWYDRLDSSLDQFEQYSPKLSRILKGRGSLLIADHLRSTIRKIREYPDLMMELQALTQENRRMGKKFPRASHDRKAKVLHHYLRSQEINIDAGEEISKLTTTTRQIQKEIRQGWVEEKTLRALLRNYKSIARKFDEVYIEINSVLLNIKYN